MEAVESSAPMASATSSACCPYSASACSPSSARPSASAVVLKIDCQPSS